MSKHLTLEQRSMISGLNKLHYTKKAIAEQVGVHPTTIARELVRNKSSTIYLPYHAHQLAQKRKAVSRRNHKFQAQDFKQVTDLLQQDYSPEQVSTRLCLEQKLNISHETIYKYIAWDKFNGGELYKHRRHPKPYRHCKVPKGLGLISNRVDITDRPAIVEKRERIGDWEGDTIISSDNKGAIVTLVDRASRFTIATLVSSKNSELVANTIIEMLKPYPCHTLTLDNGLEFAKHEVISKNLGISVYFAHPYSSWERGTNENTNGLIRQYVPKKSNFSELNANYLGQSIEKLNNRPRKCLCSKSPYEIMFNTNIRYTSRITDVALQI